MAKAKQIYKAYFSVEQTKKARRSFQAAVRKYRKDHGLPYSGAFNSWPNDPGEMAFRKRYQEKFEEFERMLVINLLAKFGYDGLVYRNEYEGSGRSDSYVVFSPSQIRIVKKTKAKI